MQDFKNILITAGKTILFFAGLLAIMLGISKKIDRLYLENDNLVQSRNKSIYRILREKENTIDIVVVGDSLSYSSVSPMELWKEHGITTYVCGQPGQKIQETYHMLETAFANQSPKLVILETNTMFRGAKSLEFKNIKDTLEEMMINYFTVLRAHDIWKNFVVDTDYAEENYKGFTFRCGVKAYKKGEYMQKTDRKAEMPDTVVFYMQQIVELCEKNNAKLLLLGTPSPVNYNYGRHNSIAAYAKEKNLDYLDMNLITKEIGINWKTDSLDRGDHLNLSGAGKVTKYLGKYLEQKYTLPDHRNEKAYDSWKKEEKDYSEKEIQHLKVIKKHEK